MPHGRTSLTHDLLHVEHLIVSRTIVRAGGGPQLLTRGAGPLSELLMGMGGAITVEYAHPGLAERAVIDHVVLQPHIVTVAAPVDGWVEQFLIARPCAGRVVGHVELHNGDDTCCARILAPAMCMHRRELCAFCSCGSW
eukprot:scaffold12792_cov64-Phaeocystis_antarctica.AAC.5